MPDNTISLLQEIRDLLAEIKQEILEAKTDNKNVFDSIQYVIGNKYGEVKK